MPSFYATDNGVKWRSLSKEYPDWETVYGQYNRWTDDPTIENIHRKLRKINRVIAGKNLMRRSVLSIVKQSEGRKKDIVEDSMQGKNKGKETASGRGYDGTRHWALVHSAGIQDPGWRTL